MKNKLKKGFTLVELVIVIAVIAILSAVLIPTFGNVISNANDSAAYSTASNALSQYQTTMASNQQAADLPDGYIFVLKSNKTFTESSLSSGISSDDVAYTYEFKNGRIIQYADESSKKEYEYSSEGKVGSDEVVSLSGTYKKTLSDGLFESDSSDSKVATITFDKKNNAVSYWGVYVLDGSVGKIKEGDTEVLCVTGKVLLLGKVKNST